MQSQPQNRTTTRVLSSVLLKNLVEKACPFTEKSEKKLNKEENRRTRRKNFFAVKTLNNKGKKDAKIAEKLSD